MKFTGFLTGGLLAVSFCLTTGNAHGALAYNFPSTLGDSAGRVANTESLGYVFTVTDPLGINVTHLGMYDDTAQNGFSAVIHAAIYGVTVNEVDNSITAIPNARYAYDFFRDAGATEDRAGVVRAGTSTRVKDVPDVVLAPGTYILVQGTVAAGGGDLEQFYRRSANPAGPEQPTAVTGSGISFGGNYTATKYLNFENNQTLPGTWTYDATAAGWTPGYAAANFDFTPVPEPVHFAMAGAGMLGLIYIGRGLWQRRKAA